MVRAISDGQRVILQCKLRSRTSVNWSARTPLDSSIPSDEVSLALWSFIGIVLIFFFNLCFPWNFIFKFTPINGFPSSKMIHLNQSIHRQLCTPPAVCALEQRTVYLKWVALPAVEPRTSPTCKSTPGTKNAPWSTLSGLAPVKFAIKLLHCTIGEVVFYSIWRQVTQRAGVVLTSLAAWGE